MDQTDGKQKIIDALSTIAEGLRDMGKQRRLADFQTHTSFSSKYRRDLSDASLGDPTTNGIYHTALTVEDLVEQLQSDALAQDIQEKFDRATGSIMALGAKISKGAETESWANLSAAFDQAVRDYTKLSRTHTVTAVEERAATTDPDKITTPNFAASNSLANSWQAGKAAATSMMPWEPKTTARDRADALAASERMMRELLGHSKLTQ